jgi:hypothetical protein
VVVDQDHAVSRLAAFFAVHTPSMPARSQSKQAGVTCCLSNIRSIERTMKLDCGGVLPYYYKVRPQLPGAGRAEVVEAD